MFAKTGKGQDVSTRKYCIFLPSAVVELKDLTYRTDWLKVHSNEFEPKTGLYADYRPGLLG